MTAPSLPTLTIANAKPSDTAEYSVRVTNKFGSALSNPAQVNVEGSISATEKPTLGERIQVSTGPRKQRAI